MRPPYRQLVDRPWIWEDEWGVIAGSGGRFVVATLAFSLFERAWTLAGMEEVLVAMAAGDPFVDELFDRILAFDEEVVRRAVTFEIDGVRFGDDWGQQRGLIMGPALWRKYIRPRIARLYSLVKSTSRSSAESAASGRFHTGRWRR